MSLRLTCPHCTHPAVVPDEALEKRARCKACQTIFSVKDALDHSAVLSVVPHESSDIQFLDFAQLDRTAASIVAPQAPQHGEDMTRRGIKLHTYGISIAVLLFVMLVTYLIYSFRSRDTWELDNFAQITKQCDAAMDAIAKSNDDKAVTACEELFHFIGVRKLASAFLTDRVDEVKLAYSPVKIRVEKMRLEREAAELAERRRREAREAEEAARRPIAESRPQFKERYYRDSKGALISESQTENTLSSIRTKILSMRDNAEKAYLKGVLRALEDEWNRMKLQGPVEER